MADKPVILVTGATGAQGGSVTHFLTKSGKYKVRALTRDKDSLKTATKKRTGESLVLISRSDNGVPCAKTTVQMVMPGVSCRMTQRGVKLIVGAKKE